MTWQGLDIKGNKSKEDMYSFDNRYKKLVDAMHVNIKLGILSQQEALEVLNEYKRKHGNMGSTIEK